MDEEGVTQGGDKVCQWPEFSMDDERHVSCQTFESLVPRLTSQRYSLRTMGYVSKLTETTVTTTRTAA